MARVNVDDKIQSDPRFKAVARKMGSEITALGMLVRFWQIAQDYWGKEMSLMPESIFKLEGLDDSLIEFDLAERREDGIYARGSEERFNWYLQKCRASRKASEARSEENWSPGKPKHAKTCSPVNRSSDSGKPKRYTKKENPPALAPDTALVPVLDIQPSSYEEGVSAVSETRHHILTSPRQLAEIWNRFKAECQAPINQNTFRSSQPRWNLAVARIREFPDAIYWVGVVQRIAASSFCQGVNRDTWIADFEFLCRKETHIKTLEGKYDNREAKQGIPFTAKPQKEQDAFWAKVFEDEPRDQG